MTRDHLRLAGLAAALVVYGLWSAPAPPGTGPAELAIGTLLVLATGLRQPLYMASGYLLHAQDLRLFEVVGIAAFVSLTWLPLLRGGVLGWSARGMVRDLVPLLYLFLPVLLVRLLRGSGRCGVRVLSAGLASAGVAFALRWWMEAGWGFGAVGLRAMTEGQLYLLNSPAVLFAALWLPFTALDRVQRPLGPARLASTALALIGSALCLAALAGAVHRIALMLAALAFTVHALWWLAQRRSAVVPLIGLAALVTGLVLFPDTLLGTADLVAAKSRLVGWNAREAEFGAVLDQIARSPDAMLIGDGWGALIANPAVGGWRVSYTHTFVSYTLLKTGVLGTLAMACYLICLLPAAGNLLRRDTPLALALLPPLAIGFALHTSFKYLCFGLLLTLLVLAGEHAGTPLSQKGSNDPLRAH